MVKAFTILSFRQVDIIKSNSKARMVEGARLADQAVRQGFSSGRTVAGNTEEGKTKLIRRV